MRVLGDDASFDTAERWLHHKNRGYCSATIILALPKLEMAMGKVEGVCLTCKLLLVSGGKKGGWSNKHAADSIDV